MPYSTKMIVVNPSSCFFFVWVHTFVNFSEGVCPRHDQLAACGR